MRQRVLVIEGVRNVLADELGVHVGALYPASFGGAASALVNQPIGRFVIFIIRSTDIIAVEMVKTNKSNIVIKRFPNQDLYFDLCDRLYSDERVDNIGLIIESSGGAGILNDPYQEYKKELNRDVYDFVLYIPNVINNGLARSPDWNKLKSYEDEYGDPWLRSYLSAARSTYYDQFTHEEKVSIINELFDQYVATFDNFKPDLFICDDLGSLTSVIPFHIVKKRYNGNSIWWHPTRVGNQYGVSESEKDHFPEIVESYETRTRVDLKDEYTEKASAYINNYRNSEPPRYGDRVKNLDRGPEQFGLLEGALKYFYLYNCKGYKSDFKMIPTSKFAYQYLTNVIKRRYLYTSGIFEQPDLNTEYIYFPLHFQPEWTTLVLSPLFSENLNQLDVIHKIQKSIPINYKLYVKAHPTQMSKSPRSKDFFNKIRRLDSVKVIDPRANPHNLIKNAKCIVTITGTSGLQGILYEKPVITLGDPSYSIMKSVTQSQVEELDTKIEYCLHNHSHEEQDLINYISAVLDKGFYFNREAKTSDHPDYKKNIDHIWSVVNERIS